MSQLTWTITILWPMAATSGYARFVLTKNAGAGSTAPEVRYAETAESCHVGLAEYAAKPPPEVMLAPVTVEHRTSELFPPPAH